MEADFRTRFGLTVVGLRRGTVAHERTFLNEALKLGDTLLLIGPCKNIERLRSNTRDVVIIKLPAELDEGASGSRQGGASPPVPGARSRADDQRPRAERSSG